MNRWIYYLIAIALHLLVLFWVTFPRSSVSPKETNKYVEVALSSEPGPARPGPDSGPGDHAKSAAAPGPVVEDSPPPVATIAPQPIPPPPAPEPPPEIVPPTPPPPVPADPSPADNAPPPPVEPPIFAEPPPPSVVQPVATPPVMPSPPAPSSAAPLSTAVSPGAPVSGTGRGNARQWSLGEGGNGHFYEVAYAPNGITWIAAQKAAVRWGGYLATINSAAENVYVHNLVKAPRFWSSFVNDVGLHVSTGPWLGGFQRPGSREPAGGWEWVNNEGPVQYTHWKPGEPNNTGGREDHIAFISIDSNPEDGLWNDQTGGALGQGYGTTNRGFIIEYDSDPYLLPENIQASRDYTDPALGPVEKVKSAPFVIRK